LIIILDPGANVVKIAPESAIKLTVNDLMRSRVSGDPAHPTLGERFLCGATSGAVSQAAIFPLELTKMRLAVTAPHTYSGIMHCIATVVRDEGPRALYKGLFPSLVGIIPYAGVELTTYTWLRDRYIETHDGCAPPIAAVLLCGAAASTAGQSVAYPLSLVRTRMCQQGAPGRPVLYDGMVDCIRKIIAADGYRGLYR
jgi:solute carrier family 25 phosphate transporter 23/24/25/41